MSVLLIFIKNPQLGKVKTRIAATAGTTRALDIYLQLLNHTREVSLGVEAHRHLFYSDFVEKQDNWSSTDFQKFVQQGTDLGERMKNAFEQAFAMGAKKVVIIGSDCALLTSALVDVAFQQLEEVSFVIGPALDGGYYLLGMNTFMPEVFDRIEWSTEQVFLQTQERIQTLQKSYHLLPALPDIDYESDWEQYGFDKDILK